MTTTALTIEVLRGAQVLPQLEAVAALRMTVFAQWPYLYQGDAGYERDYLAAYAASPGSVFVLARTPAGEVVGASTGLPLVDDGPGFAAPFAAAGIDPASVFYFGESVLLPAWRGQGLGHAFFDARERHAQALGGFALTAFAAVERADDDPRRPSGHRDHAMFWAGRGYTRQPGLVMQLAWQEVGHASIDHRLTFWTRPLPGAGHPEP